MLATTTLLMLKSLYLSHAPYARTPQSNRNTPDIQAQATLLEVTESKEVAWSLHVFGNNTGKKSYTDHGWMVYSAERFYTAPVISHLSCSEGYEYENSMTCEFFSSEMQKPHRAPHHTSHLTAPRPPPLARHPATPSARLSRASPSARLSRASLTHPHRPPFLPANPVWFTVHNNFRQNSMYHGAYRVVSGPGSSIEVTGDFHFKPYWADTRISVTMNGTEGSHGPACGGTYVVVKNHFDQTSNATYS